MAQSAVGRILCQGCTRSTNVSFGSQVRSFSNTVRCSKEPLPVFTPTSSPELDALLARFRNDLFIPSYLGERHRKWIYKKKYADRLLSQRTVINVGNKEEEPYELKPLDLQKRPKTKELRDVVRQMETRADWENLVPFLTGMQIARRKITIEMREWMIRKAAEAGMEAVILEAAKQVSRTGVALREVTLVRALFQAFHRSAAAANFQDPQVSRSLRQAQQAAVLLESPAHAVESGIAVDPKRKPDIIGVLLELSAARAVNVSGGADETGEVRAYAQRVLNTWTLNDFAVESQEWPVANTKLHELLPLWHGMKLALKVEEIAADKKLAGELTSRLSELSSEIDGAIKIIRESAGGRKPLGLEKAEALYIK